MLDIEVEVEHVAKRCTIARAWLYDRGNLAFTARGVAFKCPEDPWDPVVGEAVATARALGRVAKHRAKLADGLVKNADLQAGFRAEEADAECSSKSPAVFRDEEYETNAYPLRWECEARGKHRTHHAASIQNSHPDHWQWDARGWVSE